MCRVKFHPLKENASMYVCVCVSSKKKMENKKESDVFTLEKFHFTPSIPIASKG